jgi:hypothetical protein
MNRIELNTKIELFRRELRLLEAIKPGCEGCEYGSRKGWCEKHQATPPAEVQAMGCDDWSYDEIPF